MPAPLIIAHRGDSHARPENTLSAFQSALQVGIDLIEFDVQLTKDGHAVVIHDSTLDRTTTGKGRVADLTLAEIRMSSAGYPARFGNRHPGEKVPTLVEALAFLRERARVMIEIKPESVTDDEDGGIEAHVVADVRKTGMEKDVALISFSRKALLRCRKHAPDLVRGHLFHEGSIDQMLQGAHEVQCDLVMPETTMLSAELRDRAKQAGIRVATWVVDDPEELRSLLDLELYGIASNKPGQMLEALRETRAY